MLLDVLIDKASLPIPLDDPFRADVDALLVRIRGFAVEQGATVDHLDLGGLIPKMIKGIAGCEKGCPADAKQLVSRGVRDFALSYIEGGILAATAQTGDGRPLSLKMFPDF